MILSQSVISAIEQAVFDLPMGTDDGQQLARASLLRAEAGDAIYGLVRGLMVSDAFHTAFQPEHLLSAWPIKVVLEFITDRDGAAFDTSMPSIDVG